MNGIAARRSEMQIRFQPNPENEFVQHSPCRGGTIVATGEGRGYRDIRPAHDPERGQTNFGQELDPYGVRVRFLVRIKPRAVARGYYSCVPTGRGNAVLRKHREAR